MGKGDVTKAFRLVLPKNLAFGCFCLKSIVKSKLLKALPSSAQKYHLEFASFVTTVPSLASPNDLHKPITFQNLCFMVKILQEPLFSSQSGISLL